MKFRCERDVLVDALAVRPNEVLVLMILFRGDTDTADMCIATDLPRAMDQLAGKIQTGFFSE